MFEEFKESQLVRQQKEKGGVRMCDETRELGMWHKVWICVFYDFDQREKQTKF